MLKIPDPSGTLPPNSPESGVPSSSSGTSEKEWTFSSASSPKKGLTSFLAGVAKVERVLRRNIWRRHFSRGIASPTEQKTRQNKTKPQILKENTGAHWKVLGKRSYRSPERNLYKNKRQINHSQSSIVPPRCSQPSHLCWEIRCWPWVWPGPWNKTLDIWIWTWYLVWVKLGSFQVLDLLFRELK